MTVTAHPATGSTAPTHDPIAMRGLVVTPRVTGEDSAGAVSILEQEVQPGAGSPPHRCTRETKVVHVLTGEFTVLHGDAPVAVSAGGSVVVAPGVRHNFTNVGETVGRVMVTLTPGGHERFLAGLAAMGGPANADPVALAAHCAAYGVDLCG